MAIDSALLDLAEGGAAFLRLYRWEPFCISFGRHEPAARRYDRVRITELGIDCVRRPTGGRAVWHARELTYAVAAPLAQFGGLKQAYREIHALLAAALATLGAPAELAGSPARAATPAAGPCFSSPAGGEVLLGSRKVAGSAQLRQGDAFLQHGSVLLEDDQSLLRDLAGLTGAAPETSLSGALGRPVGFAEAAHAVAREAASRWDATPAMEPPGMVRAGAERHVGRFRDDGWTWQR
jgi:lipoate-protein ligase A